MKTLEMPVPEPGSRQRHTFFALCATTLLIALFVPSQVIAYTPVPAKTVQSCDKTGQCKDIHYPAWPNAGACTRFLRQWRNYYDNDESLDACTDFMGFDKYCADRDAYIVIDYVDAPGTWHGTTRILKCSPNFHADSIGDQFIHIWTGIGEGLITAAPFVAEGVLAVTCAYGQLYACAVLALEVSAQAGLKIPGEVGDAVYI
ncbi:MAG: hypothetical protein ACREO9_10365, partial [Lysobacterales bacterium]